MLNSLVRVSRRDRWMAYKTPQIVERMYREAPNINTHSTQHSAMSATLRASTQAPMYATSNGLLSPYTTTHHSASQESITGYTPKSTTLPSSRQRSNTSPIVVTAYGKQSTNIHHKLRVFLTNGSTTQPMSTSENINHYATFSSTRLPLSGFTYY